MLLSASVAALAFLTPSAPPCGRPAIRPAVQDAQAAPPLLARRASLAATAPLLTVVAPNYALAGAKDTVSLGEMAGNFVLFSIVLALLAFLGSYALQFAAEVGGISSNLGEKIDKALEIENEGRTRAPKPTGPIYDDSNERDLAAFKAKPMSEKAKAKAKSVVEAKGAGVEYAPWMRGAFDNMDQVAKREKERRAARKAKERGR